MLNQLNPAAQSGGYQPLARRLRRVSPSARRAEAQAFLALYHAEMKTEATESKRRLKEVDRQIKKAGTYVHTPDELTFGARVAWRNHAQCIGRLYWRSLQVVDRRTVVDPDDIAENLTQHMQTAMNGGKIRSVITVFAPVTAKDLPAHVGAVQITRYAGHLQRSGDVIGDRANVEATREAQAAGWKGTGGAFDVLPVPIITADGRRVFREIPADATQHIRLKHAQHAKFEDLNLQWYAIPCISGMILSIGGIDYPCAPFNGFYMSTEIASRNLADPWRYDMLKASAAAFGFDPDVADPLWRDRTLTELNAAVLQSYQHAGVTLLDHHTAARDFMQFRAEEAAKGRALHANWSWIVPPQASAVSPPFHLDLHDDAAVPNYYHSWISDGWPMLPFDGDRSRSRLGGHVWAAKRWLIRRMRKPGTFVR